MSVRDAISHAIYGDPAAMKDSLSSTLDAKVADALELKRISVASEYFNMPEEEYEEAEVDEGALGDAAKAVGSSAADAARTATHKVRLGRTREKYHTRRAQSADDEGDKKGVEKHAGMASAIRKSRREIQNPTTSNLDRRYHRRKAIPKESYEGETLEARDPRTPYDPNEGRGKYFAGSSKTKKEIEIDLEKKKGTRKKGRDPRGLTFTGQEK